MDELLRRKLTAALDSPDPLQRRHAAAVARLKAAAPLAQSAHLLLDGDRPPAGPAADLADLARVKACPHFARPDGCGCQFGRCGLTGRPTSFPACRTCLAAAEPPPL